MRTDWWEDPRKIKWYRAIYLAGGVFILGLGVVLLLLFIRRDELPALLLALVAFFWSVMLVYHAAKIWRAGTVAADRLGPPAAGSGAPGPPPGGRGPAEPGPGTPGDPGGEIGEP